MGGLRPRCPGSCAHHCGFVTEPPSSPLSLAVEEVSENSVTLTWKAPEKTGRSGLDGYVVEICKDGSRLGLSCLVSMGCWCGMELGRTWQCFPVSCSHFFAQIGSLSAESLWLQISVISLARPQGLTALLHPARGWRRNQCPHWGWSLVATSSAWIWGTIGLRDLTGKKTQFSHAQKDAQTVGG